MSFSYLDYALRQPRHEVSESGLSVEAERAAGREPNPVTAGLLDLSREGFQLQTGTPLDVGEAVAITVPLERPGLGLRLTGTVRWQEPDGEAAGEARWRCGCLIATPLDWETLGELFLAGVLVRHEA